MSTQERTIPDSVSMCNVSSTNACSFCNTEKSLRGPSKEGSKSRCCKLAPYRLESARDGKRKHPQLFVVVFDTEDKCFVSHPAEKIAAVTSVSKSGQNFNEGQNPDRSDQIEVERNTVPLEPISLAQIVRHETGAPNVGSMPGELYSNPFAQTRANSGFEDLSLTDLANLSSQAPSCLRHSNVKEKHATLSDLSSHYEIVSELPNLFHNVGVHVVATTCASVLSASSVSPDMSVFKSNVTVQFDPSVKGKSDVFALMLSHPAESSIPHSLDRLRQYVDKKLMKEYVCYFFKVFDFSSKSPDDIVQEKQHNVFQI